jgi:hypothetical protein
MSFVFKYLMLIICLICRGGPDEKQQKNYDAAGNNGINNQFNAQPSWNMASDGNQQMTPYMS